MYSDGAGQDYGHIRVFGLSASSWSQVGQDIDGEASGDISGQSVSLSSDGSPAWPLERCTATVLGKILVTFASSGSRAAVGARWGRTSMAKPQAISVRQPRAAWPLERSSTTVLDQFWSRSRLRALGQHFGPSWGWTSMATPQAISVASRCR
ncbi:unnamed protein product [Prorocentrum cordatum]|uniref:Uncharacterized protein n=1 Tax=Prorocentrum cordatum TaxID=2364126 RepID=A0ABN9R3E9_9DINO|nr:unnamed protein product [Polarella glacialis]